jgi:hypothetical protein
MKEEGLTYEDILEAERIWTAQNLADIEASWDVKEPCRKCGTEFYIYRQLINFAWCNACVELTLR